jgi:hypothetical protein
MPRQNRLCWITSIYESNKITNNWKPSWKLWARRFDVYYEELISDPYYLFSKLDIKKAHRSDPAGQESL